MLHAGYVFCTRCGHATSDAYYYNGETNVWVQLKRTFMGKFFLEGYTPQYMAGAVDEAPTYNRFELSGENKNKAHNLQHKIIVKCYNGNNYENKEFTRCCPFCVGRQSDWNSVNEIMAGMGNLPTYIIAVIGARTVGKSCWIHALSSPPNLNKVNHQRQNPPDYKGYILSTLEIAADTDNPPEATPVNELGNTRIMNIAKKENGKLIEVAQVLVLDFAGELFAKENEELFDNTAAHIFRGGVGYSGVDAVAFMLDLEEDPKYNLATTYNRVNSELKLLENKPVAFILNKVDKLFSNPPTENINGDPNAPEVPLFNENTFEKQSRSMYQKQSIVPRITLETALLKKMKPLVETISNETRCAGFLIKATTPILNENKEPEFLNFEESINVMDPFLWILNELDIFPIEDPYI